MTAVLLIRKCPTKDAWTRPLFSRSVARHKLGARMKVQQSFEFAHLALRVVAPTFLDKFANSRSVQEGRASAAPYLRHPGKAANAPR